MDAAPRLFPRFFAFSALLHASLGAIGVVMVRVGSTGEATTTAAVEVSLVETVLEVPAGVTRLMREPAPLHATVAPAPIDESNPPAEPSEDTASPADLGDLATAVPRLDAASGADTGIMDNAPSSPLTVAGGAAQGGVEGSDGVRAWLEAHKRYPRAAEQRNIEGEATVELVLDADSTVVSSRIVRSSGYAVLDEEVTRMVARATPFPATARPQAGTRQYRIVVEFYLEEK